MTKIELIDNIIIRMLDYDLLNTTDYESIEYLKEDTKKVIVESLRNYTIVHGDILE